VNGFGLDFLEQYHKDGDELLNHIIRVDEIWISFMNVEIKEQSKQSIHSHSPNKPKKFKQTSARKSMVSDGEIPATRDYSNVKSVWLNIK
jgi:uncharacterized damage-inducible protein DinB